MKGGREQSWGRLAVELIVFAAAAAFAALHWAALVVEPPTGRVIACVAIATGLGLALDLAARLPREWRPPSAALAVAVGLASGLAAIGLEPRLLLPSGWSELGDELADGLAGASELPLPYAGEDEWTRLGLLLAVPLALTLAATVSFLPRRRGTAARMAGLVVVVALYTIAVTWDAPSSELQRGLPLLLLIGAWIWLPSLSARRAIAAGVMLLLAGLIALPAAGRVEAAAPIINYKEWALFGGERSIEFRWDHSYGLLDWPQQGTAVATMTSERPIYWKTTVLDVFDGSKWRFSPELAASMHPVSPPAELSGVSGDLALENEQWIVEYSAEIEALRSDLVIGAGTLFDLDGIEAASPLPSGELVIAREELERGVEYRGLAYVPNPTVRRLRASRPRYPDELVRYTSFFVPASAVGLADSVARWVPVRVGLNASNRREAEAEIRGTAYEGMYELARSLTDGAPTPYDAVEAVQRHLEENYEYDQNVPAHHHPLPAFLFEDRRGYCQQFAGAMALMLRMSGIPARVVSGFAPGLADPDDDTLYTVRDTDAHSWVEVWFEGIGWVEFDPTPSEPAPAATENSPVRTRNTANSDSSSEGQSLDINRPERRPQPEGTGGGRSKGRSPAGVLLFGSVAAGYGGLAWMRRRRMLGPGGADAQIRELERALPRMGWELPPGGTLLQLEERLRSSAGPSATRYIAALRESRYRAETPRRPGPGERSALRRALRRGHGPISWWRSFRALPPGGPALRG